MANGELIDDIASQPAIFLSGTAPSSLGEALVSKLCAKYHSSPIVAIDKQHNPTLDCIRNARSIVLDLNPLTSTNSYERLAGELDAAIQHTQVDLGFPGVGTVILAAGTYDSGTLVDSSIEARKRLVGVNVCGKIELLHAVLRVNQTLGLNSSEELTLVDVGALHGLAAPGGRSVYAATKALGLALCLSLQRGREVKRVIYMAPGPIDTHMLHRNHWVSKENGSVEFFEHVRAQDGSLYEDVFVRCDDAAFAEATSSRRTEKAQLADVFARYKSRREEQFNGGNGVLRATDVAHQIVEVLADEAAYSDDVYILTAPGGQVQMENLAFPEAIRRYTEP